MNHSSRCPTVRLHLEPGQLPSLLEWARHPLPAERLPAAPSSRILPQQGRSLQEDALARTELGAARLQAPEISRKTPPCLAPRQDPAGAVIQRHRR